MSNLRKSLLTKSIGSIYASVEERNWFIPEVNPDSPVVKAAMLSEVTRDPVLFFDVLRVHNAGKQIGYITRM